MTKDEMIEIIRGLQKRVGELENEVNALRWNAPNEWKLNVFAQNPWSQSDIMGGANVFKKIPKA